MKNCDAQGCKTQGVSFTVVNGKSIGLFFFAVKEEVEDVYKDVDGGKKVAKYYRAGAHWEEDQAGGDDQACDHEDSGVGFFGVVEGFQVNEKEEGGAVFVYKQQAGGEKQIDYTQEIDLSHAHILYSGVCLFKYGLAVERDFWIDCGRN